MDLLQQAVDPGTWPWIVGGLVAAIVGLAGWFAKLFTEQRKDICDKRALITKLYEERIAAEVEMARLIERSTMVLQSVQPYPTQLEAAIRDLKHAVDELTGKA